MIRIESVATERSGERARALFREYGQFLRIAHACGTFDSAAFEEEVASLPGEYANRGGEVLLALVDESPAACVAYRTYAERVPFHQSCEIKRLFVRPAFRKMRLARLLVREALSRAEAQGFTRVVLDTDTVQMPAAYALYTEFGFKEYAPRQGDIARLHLLLPCALPAQSV